MPAYLKILSPHEYRVQELSAPAQEPVSLTEAKTHLRVSDSAQDDEIAGLVTAARVMCEAYAGKILITRTLAIFLDDWPGIAQGAWWDGVREGVTDIAAQIVRLPVSPIAAVDDFFVHDDAGGARTLLQDTDYRFDALGGRLSLVHTVQGDLRTMNAYEIRVTAGYGDAAGVPAVYKQAIRQVLAHLYANRGDTPTQALAACGAAALLAPFREVSLR